MDLFSWLIRFAVAEKIARDKKLAEARKKARQDNLLAKLHLKKKEH